MFTPDSTLKEIIAQIGLDLIYTDDEVHRLYGSRAQTILRDKTENRVYVHVNRRGNSPSRAGNKDPFTLDINDERGNFHLVVQVDASDLFELAAMFQRAGLDALNAERDADT